jgi:hypothetical protein
MPSDRPGTRLADAQLLIAESCGFRSWPKLKSYVKALNDWGRKLIPAIGSGDLKIIRQILGRHPGPANANADLEQRALMPVDYSGASSEPRELLTLPLVHLAIVQEPARRTAASERSWL